MRAATAAAITAAVANTAAAAADDVVTVIATATVVVEGDRGDVRTKQHILLNTPLNLHPPLQQCSRILAFNSTGTVYLAFSPGLAAAALSSP